MKNFIFYEYNTNIQHDGNELKRLCHNNELIQLIKLYRSATNASLNDSKNIMDQCVERDFVHQRIIKIDENKVIYFFKKAVKWVDEPIPLTKQQVLNIIDKALEQKDSLYFNDYLDVLQTLINNIKQYGGLKKISEDYEKFINAL